MRSVPAAGVFACAVQPLAHTAPPIRPGLIGPFNKPAGWVGSGCSST